jgi:alkylated DNA repair dioxygenase AlkB
MSDFGLLGYTHLKNIVDKQHCENLVVYFKNILASGKTVNDDQCPLSPAVYGAPEFELLLENLTPRFEAVCGKELYPTYSYARFYVPGDTLKPHTDRPSCEFSASVTLGFDPNGAVWPIYISDCDNSNLGNKEKVVLDIGDAVFYRGTEKLHWRDLYTEGGWQAQVFLHYVDKNGPYAEWKHDKRLALSSQSGLN